MNSSFAAEGFVIIAAKWWPIIGLDAFRISFSLEHTFKHLPSVFKAGRLYWFGEDVPRSVIDDNEDRNSPKLCVGTVKI